jgi:hypothetical protein
MANDSGNQDLETQKKLAEISKKILEGKKLSLEEQKLLNLEKKKSLDLSLKELEVQVKSGQRTQGQADLEKQIALTKKEIYELSEGQAEIDVERLAGLQKTLELTENLSSKINDAATQGRLFADNVAPISNSFSRAAVASLEAGEGVKGLGAAFGAYALNAAKGLSLSRALFSTVERLVSDNIKTMEALDEIEAGFVRATGASREFATEAFELRFALSAVGVSGKQAVETMESLYSNMSEFSQLSKTSRNDFNELAAMIDHLGGNAAGMGQTLTKVAGMSISQTSATMTRLYGVAESLGIPFSQISDDVQAMGPLFAKFGTEAVDIFEGLQAASKATGLSVNELYGVVSQFDSFENAAQAAGRLHAALGVNIDSYTLLNANEEERILILQDLMAASGKTFEELSRYEKIELSNALGASLEETAQIFGTTRGEVEKTAAQLLYAGMTQEELEEKVKAGTTAMEKLGLVMQNLAIAAEPLVNTIQFLADKFLGFTEIMQDLFGEKFGGFIAAAGALVIGLGSLVIVGKLVMGTFGGVGASAAAAAASMTTAAASMTTAATAMRASATAISQTAPALGAVGPAVTPAIPAILAFGGAIALIGIGIGAAALGMSFLVAQFKDMDAGQITGISVAIGIFAAVIVGLGFALAKAAVPLTIAAPALWAFAGAVALVGAGIGFAAAAMGYFVSQLKEMNADEIGATAEAIYALAAAIGILSVSLVMLGSLGPVAGLGLGILAGLGLVLASTVSSIAGVVNQLDEEKVSSFATVLSSLAQLASMPLTDTGVPEYIAAIGKALDELPDETDKAIAFRTTTDSLANLMQIASTVEAEQVARIETIIGAVSNSEGNERIEKVSNTLSSILSNVFDNKNSDGGSRKIVIELDGKKLGEYIDKRENAKARRYAQFT